MSTPKEIAEQLRIAMNAIMEAHACCYCDDNPEPTMDSRVKCIYCHANEDIRVALKELESAQERETQLSRERDDWREKWLKRVKDDDDEATQLRTQLAETQKSKHCVNCGCELASGSSLRAERDKLAKILDNALCDMPWVEAARAALAELGKTPVTKA